MSRAVYWKEWMGEDQLWVCPSCGAELNSDCVGSECPACKTELDDEGNPKENSE